MIDLILLLLSMALFVTYLAVIWKKFGVPHSISETFYLMKNGWIFSLVLFLIVIILMPAFIDYSKPNFTCLAFLPAAALAFVAFAPHFKDGMERKVHIGATVVCAVCSQAWVAVHQPWFLLLWVAYLIYMGVKIAHLPCVTRYNITTLKPVFWVEVTAFAATYLALLVTALTSSASA